MSLFIEIRHSGVLTAVGFLLNGILTKAWQCHNNESWGCRRICCSQRALESNMVLKLFALSISGFDTGGHSER